MIAAIVSEEVFNTIHNLNRRGLFDVRRIMGNSIPGILKNLETEDVYSHIIVDVDCVRGNIELGLDLLQKLKTEKATTKIIAVVLNLFDTSGIERDIKDMGITDIIVKSGPGLAKHLNDIFIRDNIMAVPASKADNIVATGGEQEAVTYIATDEEAHPHQKDVLPPSQIPRAEIKAKAPLKAPAMSNLNKAIVIAVSGLGQRIGTTTQAMQLALYLKGQEYTVCIVQLFDNNSLSSYLEIMDDVSVVDEDRFMINGINIFTSGKSISKAKANFQYVVCDYGNFLSLPDVSAFLDKEIKVVVAGIKPWESADFGSIAVNDDGSINYIFSFVPSNDHKTVREQMLDSAGKTHFAPYTPDYWSFCGKEDIYKAITCNEALKNESKKPGRRGIFTFGK